MSKRKDGQARGQYTLEYKLEAVSGPAARQEVRRIGGLRSPENRGKITLHLIVQVKPFFQQAVA